MLYIYTGDGKGKTSASLGLLLRAYGAEKKAAIIFFDKNPDYCTELKALRVLGIPSFVFGKNRIEAKGFRFGNTPDDLSQAQAAFAKAEEFLAQGVEILVLDEFLNALRLGQIKKSQAIDFLDRWPKNQYLFLTGRGLSPEVLARADLVSEIKMVKHPFYDKKAIAVRGVDY